MGLLTTIGRIGTKTILGAGRGGSGRDAAGRWLPRPAPLWNLLPNTRPIAIGAGVAGAAVAADVAFTGGEVLVAPVAGNIGEAVGGATAAFGGGIASGALDQALGASLPGVPTTGGGDRSFIAIAIIGVVAFLVLRK